MSRVLLRKKGAVTSSCVVTDNGRTEPTRAFQHGAVGHGAANTSTKSFGMHEFKSKTQFVNNALFTHKGITLEVFYRMSEAGNVFYRDRDIALGKKRASIETVMKNETPARHTVGSISAGILVFVDGVRFTGGTREFKLLSFYSTIRFEYDPATYKPRTN